MRTDSLRPRARLRAWVHERAFARRVPLRLERPAFSFTFDDAPLSALETAAPRLESVGARGTFYLAGRATESGGSSISRPWAKASSSAESKLARSRNSAYFTPLPRSKWLIVLNQTATSRKKERETYPGEYASRVRSRFRRCGRAT